MNGFQNDKQFNLEKPVPGCLGRMVNLFDLGTVTRNGLLTDKPHNEDISGDQIKDKVVLTENLNGTPMKMLIDQEMSKEIDSSHNSPSLVAKLMGLDTLPQQIPTQRKLDYSRNCKEEEKEYKDIHEIWQKSRKTNKGRYYDDTIDNKKLSLVRQKFTEAKNMATDEKLRQSKKFQEAVEVLSSNKDSFLQFLQEPNPLFTHRINNMHETKRITVLKPSKMLDNTRWKVDEYPTEPTRIVVLKPTVKPRISHEEDYFQESVEEIEKKTIPQFMREKLELSNGYIGDESSFDKSEIEYVDDVEVMSPNSRHSWECINRLDSPFSSSSFSRASFSPESSVSREAKKRLSERWAVMASNGNNNYQEPKHSRRSSSTLGEMLAMSDTNKACNNIEVNNLPRSKSVPVSSTENLHIPDHEEAKSDVSQGESKGKRSSKSSFKGKVTSLFFSRNKKSSKEGSSTSQSSGNSSENEDSRLKISSPHLLTSSNQAISPKLSDGQNIISHEEGVSVKNHLGSEVLVSPSRSLSNQIDKSPPIGSISRTLSCEGSYVNKDIPYQIKTVLSSRGANEEEKEKEKEEEELLFFVQTLLLEAGFNGDMQYNTFMAKLYSPKSPLHPSLREKYIDSYERKKRLTRKLVFDCVNEAMIEIKTRYEFNTCQTIKVFDNVWDRIKEWFSSEMRCVLDNDCEDLNILVLERVVKKEVLGKGSVKDLRVEMDNIVKEIEKKLFEELLEEAVLEWV